MILKSFAFALGTSAAPHSGAWHLWVQEDDVHLDLLSTRPPVAFTAYKTGRWRIAMGDAISRWTRPKDFRPGWTRGPDLLVPGSTLPLPALLMKEIAPVTWFAPPEPGSLARFTMLFAGPRSAEYPWRPGDLLGTTEMAVLSLRTLGSLYFCRHDEINDDPEHAGEDTVPPSLSIRVSADHTGVPSLRESYLG